MTKQANAATNYDAIERDLQAKKAAAMQQAETAKSRKARREAFEDVEFFSNNLAALETARHNGWGLAA